MPQIDSYIAIGLMIGIVRIDAMDGLQWDRLDRWDGWPSIAYLIGFFYEWIDGMDWMDGMVTSNSLFHCNIL